jgi:hypothetical protein
MTRFHWLLMLLAAVGLAGCASSPAGPAELRIAPGAYSRTFDAARDTVASYGFELDRVDARAGVITSRPKTTGGLLTPWDREQSTARNEIEDVMNDQQRRVRITFAPAEGPGFPEGADLRAEQPPMTARVEVAIDRIHHTGWRVEASSVQQSRRWRDPALQARGMEPVYEVPFTLDPQLAARITARIAEKVDGATPVAAETQAPRPVTPVQPAKASREPTGYWE